MGTRIENLHKKSSDIVETKNALSEKSSLNSEDQASIRELLSGLISDESDVSSLSGLQKSLEKDAATIENDQQENENERKDAVADTDEYISALESNLSKLQEIQATSDLVRNSEGVDNTKARIAELQSIREMLEGENNIDLSEDVSIDKSSSGTIERNNPFIESLKAKVETSSYSYTLGVLTKGTLSSEYEKVLKERHENAEPKVKKVFDQFKNKLHIQDSNYPPNQTPHYLMTNHEGRNRGVYINAEADANNPKGAGTTYFHELAHMIDHASTGFCKNISDNPEFGKALIEDGQRILNLYNNLSDEKKYSFKTRIRTDAAHSFSDLIDATTNGQLRGSYGHSREYWSRSGNLQAEAFAHFFEASMGNEYKLNLLSNFFPTAFGEFTKMIESIESDQFVRILERSR